MEDETRKTKVCREEEEAEAEAEEVEGLVVSSTVGVRGRSGGDNAAAGAAAVGARTVEAGLELEREGIIGEGEEEDAEMATNIEEAVEPLAAAGDVGEDTDLDAESCEVREEEGEGEGRAGPSTLTV